MTIIKDLLSLINTLTLVDYIFFMAIIVLLILIVTLIYFIKINKEEEIIILPTDKINDDQNIPISLSDIGADPNDQVGELIDLESVTKALEERVAHPVEMTDYELEQEERAIISYDELVAKNSNLQLNYETPTEDKNTEISIKKVDLGNLVSKIDDEPPKNIEVKLISYEKEEAFLEALRHLKEQIN